MSLGTRLKRERERRGWSQMYVAEKLGITNSVLSNYERDYRDPDTKMLTKIAELYEVSADYLLGMSIARTPAHGMAFSGGGKDWTEEELRMAEAIAAATIENMRKQQGK